MKCFRRSDPHSCGRMQVAERCVNTPRPTHLTDATGKGADVIMTHPDSTPEPDEVRAALRREPEYHSLTEKEKELRDWLRDQPDGDEKWFVIKAGFRRSYFQGIDDTLNRLSMRPGGAA